MATTNLQNEYSNTTAASPRLQLNTNGDIHTEPKLSSRTSSTVDTDDVESLDSENDTTMDRIEFFLYRSRYSDEVSDMSALGFGSHTGMNTQSLETQTHTVADTTMFGEATNPITSDELEVVTTLFKLLSQVEERVAQRDEQKVEDNERRLSPVDKPEDASSSDDESSGLTGAVISVTVVTALQKYNELDTTADAKELTATHQIYEALPIAEVAEPKSARDQDFKEEAKKTTVEGAEAVEAEEVAEEVAAVESAEPVVEAAVAESEEATEQQEQATAEADVSTIDGAGAIGGITSDDRENATLTKDTEPVAEDASVKPAPQPKPEPEVKSLPSSGGWLKNLLFRKVTAPKSSPSAVVTTATDIAEPLNVAETAACVHGPVVEVVADSARMDTQIAAGAQEDSAAIPQDPSDQAEGDAAVALETEMESSAPVALEHQKDASQFVSSSDVESTLKTEEVEAASDTDSSAETKLDVEAVVDEQAANVEHSTDEEAVENSAVEVAAPAVEEETESVETSVDDQDVVDEDSVNAATEDVEAQVGSTDSVEEDITVHVEDAAVEVVEEAAEPEADEVVEVQEAAIETADEAADSAVKQPAEENVGATEDVVETEVAVAVQDEQVATESSAQEELDVDVTTQGALEDAVVETSEPDAAEEAESAIDFVAEAAVAEVTDLDTSAGEAVAPNAESIVVDATTEEDNVQNVAEPDAQNEPTQGPAINAVVTEASPADTEASPAETSMEVVEGATVEGVVDEVDEVEAEPAESSEADPVAEVLEEERVETEAAVVETPAISVEQATKADYFVEPVESAAQQTLEEEIVKEATEDAPAASPVEVVEATPARDEVVEEEPKAEPEPAPVETKPIDATAAVPATEEKDATATPVQKYEVDTKPISAVAFLIGRFEKIAARNAIEAANSRTSSRVSSRVSSPMPSPPSSRPYGYILDAPLKGVPSSEPKELPEEPAKVETIKEDAEAETVPEVEAPNVEEPAVESPTVEDEDDLTEEAAVEDAAVSETEEAVVEDGVAIPEAPSSTPEADTEVIAIAAEIIAAETENDPANETEEAEAEHTTTEDVVDEAETVDEASAADVFETVVNVDAEAVETDTSIVEMTMNTTEEAAEAVPDDADNDAIDADEIEVEDAEDASRETQTVTTAYETVETSILSMATPEDDALTSDTLDTTTPEAAEDDEPAVATADFTTVEAIEVYVPVYKDFTPTDEPETDNQTEEDPSDLASATKKTPVAHDESKESQATEDNQTEEPEITERRMSSISPEPPTVQTDDAAGPIEATAKATVEMTSTSQATKAVADDATAAERTPERDSAQLLPREHLTYEILGVTRANNVIMYHIYTVNGETGERSMSIPKRFSEFKLLDEKLRALGVPAAHDLPMLPKPSVGSFLRGRRSKKTIELREKAFGDFLHYITQHEELHECAVFQQFIAN
ncbi:hypothetical protein PF005_g20966 [Phytophthora fragariae]|uniref:PX domain-containing protein n=1 Tax=Phytophthora fragariae TaxID=53985 RepID=A0A6A3WP53_9STRA|nr:hypothetical protein PF009_g21093 [Phytophthora fragariae]KAE9087864.1 hypothetical protein PF007_g20209 [Phytophthora fragariae]KAE9088277.1 hypothetical protein PF010_g19435 [Phytophthora fragariae]KAE9112961.1 hypothetical protein PF006_g19868 [Phytophthora fragariae]KAE9186135.1 hypothetical protein PF005_g20966 [Phytophthora fragariae]